MNRDYNYIRLGDCVELMKEIPDDFIDLTSLSKNTPIFYKWEMNY